VHCAAKHGIPPDFGPSKPDRAVFHPCRQRPIGGAVVFARDGLVELDQQVLRGRRQPLRGRVDFPLFSREDELLEQPPAGVPRLLELLGERVVGLLEGRDLEGFE
jgi:hypothetical protein